MTTIFTLAGAFSVSGVDTTFTSKWYKDNRAQAFSYGNWSVADKSASDAVDSLDAKLRATSGKKVVIGHSMGAQVIYKWLRENAAGSPIPIDDLEFISMGNPERKFNGASAIDPVKYPPVYPGTQVTTTTPAQYRGGWGVGSGLPANPRYKVTDIAIQYDFWADYPNHPDNAVAIANVNKSNLHVTGYVNVPPFDNPNYPTWEDSGVIYKLVPTFPAPLVDQVPSWWVRMVGGTAVTNQQATVAADDRNRRPEIEKGYDRPVPVP